MPKMNMTAPPIPSFFMDTIFTVCENVKVTFGGKRATKVRLKLETGISNKQAFARARARSNHPRTELKKSTVALFSFAARVIIYVGE